MKFSFDEIVEMLNAPEHEVTPEEEKILREGYKRVTPEMAYEMTLESTAIKSEWEKYNALKEKAARYIIENPEISGADLFDKIF